MCRNGQLFSLTVVLEIFWLHHVTIITFAFQFLALYFSMAFALSLGFRVVVPYLFFHAFSLVVYLPPS